MAINPPSPTLRSSRRRAFGLLGGGLALLAGAPSVNADKGNRNKDRNKKRRRKPKFRTITRTFSNGSPIVLFDEGTAALYPSTVQVSGFKRGRVLDVNVTLRDINHPFPIDINVLVVAPNGRRTLLMSNVGKVFAIENVSLTLDDQAAADLPISSQLGSGRFRPTNFGIEDEFPPPAPSGFINTVKLATFSGINPNGTWRLFVTNRFDETGSIGGGWSLTIRAKVRA
jgi:subtilisin-like proprotein convertase family protein